MLAFCNAVNMCCEKGHTRLTQMSIETERVESCWDHHYGTDYIYNVHIELHLSETEKDESMDFFADIEHYQLRKRLKKIKMIRWTTFYSVIDVDWSLRSKSLCWYG